MKRNQYMLKDTGYDWWWHSFTAVDENGEEKPFFIEFYLMNPKYGQDTPVFSNTPSYLMVKAGCWKDKAIQLHRFFGWNQVQINRCPFQVEASDCLCNENTLKGSVSISKQESQDHPEWMCDYGTISWDLKIDKEVAFNVGYGTSTFLRTIRAFEMYWHAQGMKSKYRGTITFNGKTYTVLPESSYGYADKNWGANFTSPWVWLASSHLVSNLSGKELKNSVFDIGGGRPKIFFLPLNRKLLGVLYYEGKEYEFNFSKFWMLVSTQFNCHETEDSIEWYVRQSNYGYVMETKVSCLKKDMLWVNYVSPDGQKRHNRLWNGGNGVGNVKLYKKTFHGLKLIDDIQAHNIGCEYGEYD